jgi:hypothetical protein
MMRFMRMAQSPPGSPPLFAAGDMVRVAMAARRAGVPE